jgi:uncharacterized protein YndB with AHSA1/START domain
MAEQLVFPGKIDWTGENPGMYLKEKADGPFVTLLSFFRVMVSPFGRGHALVMVQDPASGPGTVERPNLCLTDNDRLARWLVSDYLAHFAAFKGLPAVTGMAYRPIRSCTREGDLQTRYSEVVQAEGLDVRLTWEGIGEAFALQLPKEKSATGKHLMLSVFAGAKDGVATVNGRRLPGHAAPREMAGRQITTAFLAFAESWLR